MELQINDDTPVFFVAGRVGVIDYAINRDGTLVSAIFGETLAQVQQRYPGAQIGKLGEVTEQRANSFKSGPVEIDEERFMHTLEVLPPVGWVHEGNTESFKLSERLYGSITTICCRIGQRYFTLSDEITLPHPEIVSRCRAAMSTTTEAPACA